MADPAKAYDATLQELEKTKKELSDMPAKEVSESFISSADVNEDKKV